MTQPRQPLAQRLHELLLRDLGHAIDSQRLLDDARYARDVLLVCEATGHPELQRLARHFRHPELASEPVAAPAALAGGHAPQQPEWAADTSGFGLSQPLGLSTQTGTPVADKNPAVERRRSWLGGWRKP